MRTLRGLTVTFLSLAALAEPSVVVGWAASPSGVGATQATPPAAGISGRWVLTYVSSVTAQGRGRAQAPGPASAERTRVVLNLKPGPADTLVGEVAAGALGGRRGGMSAPVEISEGKFDGTRFSFEVWVVDGFKNRAKYEGQLSGSTLTVKISRDTPTGPQSIGEGTATRLVR